MNLYAPFEARTSETLLIYWDKFREGPNTIQYKVYVDEKWFSSVFCTDETITGLEPDREYSLRVTAEENGQLLRTAGPIFVRTKPAGERLDVTEFGAVGDGCRLNTLEIQQAIDACPEAGTVYVPDGVFRTGALFLKSHMTLWLSEKATLLGSENLRDYPVYMYRYEGREKPRFASLINMPIVLPADCATAPAWTDVTIRGGVFNANGMALFQQELNHPEGNRGSAVALRNIDGLYLYDTTIRQAPFWCLHIIYSNHVTMNRIKIRNKFDENGNRYQGLYNGDGIDPDSCGFVNILHSSIESQDDCVAIKSGRDEEGRQVGIPSHDIRITNCEFSHGFGAAIGSEMSGGVWDVLVQDCVFHQSFSLGSVKNCRGRGSIIKRVTYENIHMINTSTEHDMTKWFKGAINVDQSYGLDSFTVDELHPVTEGTPSIREIAFRNITIDTATGYAVFLCGLPENHMQQILLENITARAPHGILVENTDAVFLNQVAVDPSPREESAVSFRY
ncbi:MAG: glycoside hydrolase family 28 protein [Clostridia bacterium]|nr:glycoside hydrolase family 28 protein [Clostridia bacterium]